MEKYSCRKNLFLLLNRNTVVVNIFFSSSPYPLLILACVFLLFSLLLSFISFTFFLYMFLFLFSSSSSSFSPSFAFLSSGDETFMQRRYFNLLRHLMISFSTSVSHLISQPKAPFCFTYSLPKPCPAMLT